MSYSHCLFQVLGGLFHGLDLATWWGFWLGSVLVTTVGLILAGGFAIKRKRWAYAASAEILASISIILWLARACQLGPSLGDVLLTGFEFITKILVTLIVMAMLIFAIGKASDL